ASVAVSTPTIGGLEEPLILTLQLVVEHDPADTGVAGSQTLGGPQISPVELRIVGELAGLGDASVEHLALPIVVPARVLEDAATSLGQGHQRCPRLADDIGHGAHETDLAQVFEVAGPRVCRTAAVVAQVAGRHYAKRANGRQRAHL